MTVPPNCASLPTYVQLLETNTLMQNCGDETRPSALTDIDVAYLRGLYRMAAGGTFIGERGSIAFAMKKDLGGY